MELFHIIKAKHLKHQKLKLAPSVNFIKMLWNIIKRLEFEIFFNYKFSGCVLFSFKLLEKFDLQVSDSSRDESESPYSGMEATKTREWDWSG